MLLAKKSDLDFPAVEDALLTNERPRAELNHRPFPIESLVRPGEPEQPATRDYIGAPFDRHEDKDDLLKVEEAIPSVKPLNRHVLEKQRALTEGRGPPRGAAPRAHEPALNRRANLDILPAIHTPYGCLQLFTIPTANDDKSSIGVPSKTHGLHWLSSHPSLHILNVSRRVLGAA